MYIIEIHNSFASYNYIQVADNLITVPRLSARFANTCFPCAVFDFTDAIISRKIENAAPTCRSTRSKVGSRASSRICAAREFSACQSARQPDYAIIRIPLSAPSGTIIMPSGPKSKRSRIDRTYRTLVRKPPSRARAFDLSCLGFPSRIY